MKQQSSRGLTVFLFLFAALVLAVALPLRIWQQLNLVESGNGFWKAGSATIPVLYAALGLLAAAPFVTGLMFRKQVVLDLGRRARVAEGAVALIVAFTLVVNALGALQFAFQLFTGQVVAEGLDHQPGASPLQYFIRSGAVAALFEALFGAAATVFFCNLALIDFLPRKKIFLNRLLALAPLLWVIARILRRFSRTIAYLRVSDLFLTLMALTMLMVFFLAFAQLLGGVNNARKEWVLAAAGIPAFALLLLCFVPRVVAYRLVGGAEPSQDAAMELCDAAVAAFICVFLAGRLLRQESGGEEEQDLPVAGE